MTVTPTSIECDNCGKTFAVVSPRSAESDPKTAMRNAAEGDGWTVDGDRDLCRECS